jgi:hypothetical protein
MKNLKEIVDYYNSVLNRYKLEFGHVYSRYPNSKKTKTNECVIIVDTQQKPEHKDLACSGSKEFPLVDERSGKYSIFNVEECNFDELKRIFSDYFVNDKMVSSWFDKRYDKFVRDNKII